MRQVLINGCLVRGCDTPGCPQRWPCEAHGTQSVGEPFRLIEVACRDCGYHVCSCDVGGHVVDEVARWLKSREMSPRSQRVFDEMVREVEEINRIQQMGVAIPWKRTPKDVLRPEAGAGWQNFLGREVDSDDAAAIVHMYPDRLAAAILWMDANPDITEWHQSVRPVWFEDGEWVRQYYGTGRKTGARHHPENDRVSMWRIVEKPADV